MNEYLKEIARFEDPVENGDGGVMTEKQLEILSQLRTRAEEENLPLESYHIDRFLARYLIAMEFDIEKALTMIKTMFEWRKKENADAPLDELEKSVAENAKKYAPPPTFAYETKDGYPIAWDYPGKMDIQGIVRACTPNDIIRYHGVYFMEKAYDVLRQQCIKHNKLIDKIVVVSDMSGFGMRDLAGPFVSTMKKVTHARNENHPQILKTMIVVHPPTIIGMCWSLIKPFLRERTRRKVNIVKGNPKRNLSELVDDDNLPEQFGGNADNPVQVHEVVSESDYLKLDNTSLTSVSVGRGKKHVVKVHVDAPGKYVSWQFQTDSKDLQYSLIHIEQEDDGIDTGTTLIETTRVSCNLVPEIGQHECIQSGYYALVLDNSYSYLTSKSVYYEFTVTSS